MILVNLVLNPKTLMAEITPKMFGELAAIYAEMHRLHCFVLSLVIYFEEILRPFRVVSDL